MKLSGDDPLDLRPRATVEEYLQEKLDQLLRGEPLTLEEQLILVGMAHGLLATSQSEATSRRRNEQITF